MTMLNRIGKGLVLMHAAFSLVLMAWAANLWLQMNDFGWKEPQKIWETKDTGRRIASNLDKRVAGLHELYRARDRALPAIKPALDSLQETMERFPKNHLFYAAELEKVRKGEGAIELKALQYKGGELVLDTPGKRTGIPAMPDAIPGIDKSLKSYREELKAKQAEIEKITPEIEELIKKNDEITVQLHGTKDDKGNSLDIGLYEVLETEKSLQDKIAAEKQDLTPIYVDAQRRTENFLERYRTMQRALQAATGSKK